MQSRIAPKRRYGQQREGKTPPHISLRSLRLALKRQHKEVSGENYWDLDDVCDQVEGITGDRPGRGTLSAVETGYRGVSAELLSALEKVYGLEPGSITTNYQPRRAAIEDLSA